MSRDSDFALEVNIMTTTDCNFACSYCYEDNIQIFDLGRDMVDSFISFLKNYVRKHNIKELSIFLFGGEPTYKWELVVETLEEIKNICEENEIQLSTSMVTNGYLLNEQKVYDLLPFNFQFVQITLDGSKEYHDKRRFTKDIEPSFEIIINNLKRLLKFQIV